MRDIKKIEEFCDALGTLVDIVEGMDEDTFDAINDRTDVSQDDRVNELYDWQRWAWMNRMGDDKIKQFCRYLNQYWDENPGEARALYPDINAIRAYLNKVSGLSVSYEEAKAALELWDFTEGDV